jgi:transposase-like protein
MSEEGKRRYTHVKELGPIIEAMYAKGRTRREIAEELGLPGKETVKEYLKRSRRMKRKSFVPSRKGRSRTRPITEVAELQRENKRLQMEVDLLRSFLQEVERR